MKAIKLAGKAVAIAALLLTASAVQATPTPTTTVDVLLQWLFPGETQPELKTCQAYPHCYKDVAPTPEPATDE